MAAGAGTVALVAKVRAFGVDTKGVWAANLVIALNALVHIHAAEAGLPTESFLANLATLRARPSTMLARAMARLAQETLAKLTRQLECTIVLVEARQAAGAIDARVAQLAVASSSALASGLTFTLLIGAALGTLGASWAKTSVWTTQFELADANEILERDQFTSGCGCSCLAPF